MAFEFDRYINGQLMAEGVTIERQGNLPDAMREAARIASRGPNGEVPVLVHRAEALSRTGAVKVKELEWSDADEGMCTKWRAAALGGHYELVVFEKEHGFAVNFHWGRPLSFWFIQGEPDEWGPTGPKMFRTLEAAKAAAKADYEHRILSALEPAAPEGQQPVAEAVEPSGNTGELIDKMAEAIRGDTASDDTPWATLSEDRKIGWRGDAERALAVFKEYLTARRPAPEGHHPDDIAVDRFAAAMKEKLARKREEGRGGWDDKEKCSGEYLSRLVREHVDKGDPVDVGNLAMMLHQRGERIATEGQQDDDRIRREMEEILRRQSERDIPFAPATRPAEQAVTEALSRIRDYADKPHADRYVIRNMAEDALRAAMEAGRHD